MKHYLGVLVLMLVFFSCKEEKERTYDLVLENGNVINIVTGAIEKQSIYILDGRIAKITTVNKEETFKSEQIIDASNSYILPGYWDNHVHFRGGDSLIEANKEFLKLFIANGITTVRDAGGDLTPSVLEWRSQIETGDLVGPTIFTAGPKIDGPNASWAGSIPVVSNTDVVKALDALQRLKVDFVKIYDSQISGEAYLQVITEATKRGMITSGHMPFTVELKETVEAGLGAVEHLYYVLKGCSSEEKEITQAIINKEYGFWQSMEKLIASYEDTIAQNTRFSFSNSSKQV